MLTNDSFERWNWCTSAIKMQICLNGSGGLDSSRYFHLIQQTNGEQNEYSALKKGDRDTLQIVERFHRV